MKFLIWLVIGLGIWWWLRQQRMTGPPRDTPHNRGPQPQTMVPCAQCGLHVPKNDAVRGTRGWYCSEAHRQQREG